jgi:aspartate aminotransferase
MIKASPFFELAKDLETQPLSDLADGMIPSGILAISYAVKEKIAQGAKVAQFTVGDFEPKYFPIPEILKQGILKAYDRNQTNYPPADGILELRKAVQTHYQKDLQLDYPLDSIMVASGARPVLYGAYRCLINPGEVVINPVPSWNNDCYSQLVGAKELRIQCKVENGFMLTAEELKPHISQARLLVICSPMNPTGTMIDADQLKEICQLIVEENHKREANGQRALYLIYDQVYRMLAFHKKHVTPNELVPEMAKYTIYIDAISKTFAATGLRVGWLVAPPWITKSIKSLISHIGAWAPRAEQLASAELLLDQNAMQTFLVDFKERLQSRLDLLYSGIQSLKIKGLPVDAISPQGAMYLSVKIDLIGRYGLDTTDDVRRFLLDQADCAAIPFHCFGDHEHEGWFRFSIGAVSLEEIQQSVDKIGMAIEKLLRS